MNRQTAAWTQRISEYAVKTTSAWTRRTALLVVGMLSAGVVWVVTVAPAAVAFALSVAVAVAWCRWLEQHPEAPARAPAVSSPGWLANKSGTWLGGRT